MKMPDAIGYILYEYRHNAYEYYCSVSKADYKKVLREGLKNVPTRFCHLPCNNNKSDKILFCMSTANKDELNSGYFDYKSVIIVCLFKEIKNERNKKHIKSLKQIGDYITKNRITLYNDYTKELHNTSVKNALFTYHGSPRVTRNLILNDGYSSEFNGYFGLRAAVSYPYVYGLRMYKKRGHLYVNIMPVSKPAPFEDEGGRGDRDEEMNYDMYIGEDDVVMAKHKTNKVIIIGELVDIWYCDLKSSKEDDFVNVALEFIFLYSSTKNEKNDLNLLCIIISMSSNNTLPNIATASPVVQVFDVKSEPNSNIRYLMSYYGY